MSKLIHKLEAVEFIPVSSVVPGEWTEWFWETFTEDAPPFTWGDNNRSLVTAARFKAHVKSAIPVVPTNTDESAFKLVDNYGITHREYRDFMDELTALGDTYIDMEN